MADKTKDAILRFEVSREAHTILTEEAKRMRVMRDGFYRGIMERAAKRIKAKESTHEA